MTIQQEVYKSVVDRGYREEYTSEQFAARQVAKLQEELWELAQRVDLPRALYQSIELAGQKAKVWFDEGQPAEDTSCAAWGLQQELADVQVVVFCTAEALNEIRDKYGAKRIDITQLALDKARKDVQRGVR